MGKAIEVNDTNFDEIIKEHPLIVVDFWAAWCGPCMMVGPIIEKLAGELADKLKFGKLNVDNSPVTSARFGVMSIPTLLVMKDGKEVDRMVGFAGEEQLKAKLKTYY